MKELHDGKRKFSRVNVSLEPGHQPESKRSFRMIKIIIRNFANWYGIMSEQYFEMIDNGIVIEDDQSNVNPEEQIAMVSFNYCRQLVTYAKDLKASILYSSYVYVCVYVR